MDLEGFEKFSSTSLECKKKSVEETIIETGKWALIAIRVPGYLPITTIRSELGLQLQLVRCSAATLYTIFVTIFALIGDGFFAHTFIDKFFLQTDGPATDENFGNTEAFVWTSLLILVCYTSYLRTSRILYCKNSLKYWKKTIALVESLVSKDYHLSSTNLTQIYSSCKNWTVFYLLIAIGRMSYGTYNLYDSFVTMELNSTELKALFLDLFLALTLCFHVGYAIWLTFLIKILIFCFDTIHEDLSYYNRKNVKNQIPNQYQHARRNSAIFPVNNNKLSFKEGKAQQPETKVNRTNHNEGFMDSETRIRKTIASYESIEEQMHEFNKLFGTTIVFETIFAFFLLIVNVYAGESFLELKMSTLVYVFFTMIIPVVIYSTSLFHFATQCSILSGKAVTILKKVEQFFVPTDRHQLQLLQLKLAAFIARVADNPPSISASHFFSVNRRLLTSILGTSTTYLIVLLQFRQAGVPASNSFNQNATSAMPVCPGNSTWTCQCSW